MIFDIFAPDTASAAPMWAPAREDRTVTETFTVGEEAILAVYNRRVRVEFGPYRRAFSSAPDTYLVKYLEGPHTDSCIHVSARRLLREPKFAVGDKVTVLPLDTPATVAGGPFVNADDKTRYVVKHETGSHLWVSEDTLTKVPEPQTFTLNGVSWDLKATYVDRDGDAWVFSGEHNDAGVPLMDSPEAGLVYRNFSLPLVLTDYGPLTVRV